ncbi:MAG: hypothetical protein EXR86_01160 [Gammaproteobacteria bacterium]|nr:hypothetical protein [Gammaproteobacteria bacterium]
MGTFSGSVLAIDPGTASGQLVVDAVAISLSHANTFRFDDLAELGQYVDFEPELRILLTEQAIDSQLLQELETKQVQRQAQAGTLKGVLIALPRDAKREGTVTALLPQQGIPFYTIYSLPGFKVTISGNRVSGKIEFHAPDNALTVTAKFSAPLFHEIAPAAILKEETARTSAPALAYLEMERRLKAEDFLSARASVTSEMLPQIVDLEARAKDPAFVSQFTERLPATGIRRAQIRQAVLYRSLAYLVIVERRESIVTLRQLRDHWLVDD